MQNRNLFIFSALLLLFACAKKIETKEEYIQKSLKERIAKHIEKKSAKCAQILYTQATGIADSILLQEALKLDSLQEKLPTVPPKPGFIEPKPSEDSLTIEPFLDTRHEADL